MHLAFHSIKKLHKGSAKSGGKKLDLYFAKHVKEKKKHSLTTLVDMLVFFSIFCFVKW